MAILNPSIEEIKSIIKPIPEEGELYLIEKLTQLDDTYEIFFQPFLNGDHPDIMILKRNVGMYIIEVKDYRLGAYQYDSNSQRNEYGALRVVNANNTNLATPFEQVMRYKTNLYNLHSELLKDRNLYSNNIFSILKVGVFFYNATQEEVKNKFSSCQSKDIKYIDLWGRDSQVVQTIKSKLESEKYKSNQLFDNQLYKEIKVLLEPSFHKHEQCLLPELTKRQLLLSKSQPNKKVKIKGEAGSGKTLVLAKRAINAYVRTEEPVLILTFNITLRNYITDKISQFRAESHKKNFYVIHFHEFIKQQMNKYNILYSYQMEEGDLDIREIRTLLEMNKTRIRRFKTIMVDEVQDFQYEWLKTIEEYFLEIGGEYVLFGDEKQNIYDRQLDEQKKIRTNVIGRWNTLRTKFRMAPDIMKLSQQFQEEFFKDKYELETESSNENSTIKSKISFHRLLRPSYENIFRVIKTYQVENGINYNDICILSTDIVKLRELEYYIRTQTSIKCQTMFETQEQYEQVSKLSKNKSEKNMQLNQLRRCRKFNFWMNSGQIKLCTIHSFKGWEAHTVFIMLGNEVYPHDEIIYTALTRCRKYLVFIDLEENRYRKFLWEMIENKSVHSPWEGTVCPNPLK